MYLQSSRTSRMENSTACSRQLFLQKHSLVDVWLGSKYAPEHHNFQILFVCGPLNYSGNI